MDDADADVTDLVTDAQGLNVDFQIQRLEEHMEDFAGAPRQAMGIRTPGEKTKFEVQLLDNAGNRVFIAKTNLIDERIVEKVLKDFLELSRRNLDAYDTIKIIDQDGVTEFLDITRDDIAATGKLVAKGSRHFAEQANMLQNLSGFANSALGQDPHIKAHLSGKQLAKAVSDLLGVNKYNIFQENILVAEQIETEQLMQAGRADSQEQAMIDPNNPTAVPPQPMVQQ
jgi:hypothetical protein